MTPYILIITNRLDENEPVMYQFDRFSLFLKCPFSRLFVVPFRVGRIFKTSFCNNGILSFFHILVVKERCRKQNKSVLGSVMVVLLHIFSPE